MTLVSILSFHSLVEGAMVGLVTDLTLVSILSFGVIVLKVTDSI